MTGLIQIIIKRIHGLSQKKSIWSLADQCVVSLGNFLTNILLARNLPPSDYGVYLLIYGVMAFLTSSIHSAIIIYPISIKGAISDRASVSRMTTNYLVLTILLTLPFSLVVFGGVFAATRKFQVAPIAIIAMLFWQIQETVRRALISHLRYDEAIWGDCLSYLGQAALVLVLAQSEHLSIQSILLVIALTSALAALLQIFQINLKNTSIKQVWNYATMSWDLGKWYLFSNLTSIVNIYSIPWILAIFYGYDTAAKFQVVMTLIGVSNPILFNLFGFIIPMVARTNIEFGIKRASQIAFKKSLQFGIILIPIYCMFIFFPRQVLELFYGQNSPYLNLDIILRMFVLAYVLLYFSQILAAILAGLERTKSNFIAQIGSLVCSLLLGIPLIIKLGVFGTSLASCFTNISLILILSFQLRKIYVHTDVSHK